MSKLRPEQLGWGLSADLVITSSGNYFAFDVDGNVVLDFKGINGNSFNIQTNGNNLFTVNDTGSVVVYNDLTVLGNLNAAFSGSIDFALTASHLQEQNVATFRPINTPITFSTGSFFRSSSGDWYLS